MRGRWRRAEVEGSTGVDRATEYLELAREIQAEVQRTAADPDADLDDLQRALDDWPAALRADAVLAAFRELPRGERWDVLAELFDDDELRGALAAEHRRVAADAARSRRSLELAALVHERGMLDTRDLGRDDEVTLGLFLPVDVQAAATRGPASTVCARRLVLRATGDAGSCRVVADTFNPERGLFVTPEYDESVWRTERLEPHAPVRVGALDDGFEPVVHRGARLDVETADGARRGRLHTGWATAGGISLFDAGPS